MKGKPKRRHKRQVIDRISSLPDCLLVEIISRLDSTEDAIRTGALSKRWQHLWPQLPNLIFIHDVTDEDRIFDFYSSLENILSQYAQSNINKFQLHASFLDEADVEICIGYAIDLNVREVDINVWHYRDICTGIILPDYFYTCSSFVHLKLVECYFDKSDDICWKNLKSLSITYGRLDEDVIQNILSGSPLLETLVLGDCGGIERLDIANKSVKNLVISREPPGDPYQNQCSVYYVVNNQMSFFAR